MVAVDHHQNDVGVADDDHCNELPNLRCMKDIKSFYKERMFLQPSGTYRTLYNMLDFYMGLRSKELQAKANLEWRKLKQTNQKDICESIPGPHCGCCKQIPRADKGKRRGINARTNLFTRKSKRQRNKEPDKPEVVAVSVGHTAEDRATSIPKEKQQWARQSLKRMDYAPTVQLQGGTQARKAISTAIEKTIAEATMSMKDPSLNHTIQQADVPRVHVLSC